MTREEFAQRIRWEWIIWPTGILNVIALSSGFYKLIVAHSAAGVSLSMVILFCWIDIAFAIEGYFKRNSMLKWCMGLSAIVSFGMICMILHLR